MTAAMHPNAGAPIGTEAMPNTRLGGVKGTDASFDLWSAKDHRLVSLLIETASLQDGAASRRGKALTV